ncbi:hypothetical protein ACVWXX_001223 [Bacillus toyonensis]|nr:hypothetical protein IEA_04458 [Bacillus toyonensis]EJV92768.1 hypothetical protein IGI_04449 [Bacillus toyonensis]EOP44879.1 hypothetical protein IKI_00237 [Bacillus toyonensis]
MIRMALRSFNIQMYCLLGVMVLGWLMTPFSAQFVGGGHWPFSEYVLRLDFRKAY